MPYIPTEKVVLNSAREEVDYRLKNQIAAVRSVPERQAVLNVRKQIVEGRKFPAQSDALRGHFKDMADVLAGPFPALARVEAARAVGEAIVKDNSLAVHPRSFYGYCRECRPRRICVRGQSNMVHGWRQLGKLRIF